jgi:indolepyruvate ferredoxin oxidoreductase alpha subunit
MTGYQETPGTLNGRNVRVPIEEIANGLGVRSVRVVNPNRLRKTVRAFRKVLKAGGINVLVLRAPCVARQPKTWDLGVQISQKACPGFDGCERTCIEALACPAIAREGDDVMIERDVCQSCGLCAHYCPENAIRAHPLRIRRRKVGI